MSRDDYLRWAIRIEEELRSSFAEQAALDQLHTRRFWQIHDLPPMDLSITGDWGEELARQEKNELARIVISTELDTQKATLNEIINRLRSYIVLSERPGHMVLPDTNVLLHYNRLDKVDWTKVVKARPVRFIVPHLVLDELDDKKYLGSDKIIRRARSALKSLEALRPQLEAIGFAKLEGKDVTVEYLIDEPGHRRFVNPDEEIIDRANFLKRVTNRPITIVTSDYGMRARAVARGLRVADMPSEYARDGRQPPNADG